MDTDSEYSVVELVMRDTYYVHRRSRLTLTVLGLENTYRVSMDIDTVALQISHLDQGFTT
jgi:hypothetical protein